MRPAVRKIISFASSAVLTATIAACGGGAPATEAPGRDRTDPSVRPEASPTTSAPVDPYAVGVRTLRLNRGGDRPLPVTVWYPATGQAGGRARAKADPARRRFPVVIFSHGLTGAPGDYEPLLVRWAAAGFVVAAPAYPHTHGGAARIDVLDVLNQPADASYVLTALLALDAKNGDPLRGRLDTERVGAAGHSAGGVTTVGLFTVGRDKRLSAGIVLAGSAIGVGTAFTGAAAPLLFVHGARDEVVSYASGKAVYDAVPWPKAMLTLPDGDHGRALGRAGDPAFQVIAGVTVEFLRWSLYGDPAARQRLPEAGRQGGLATLDDAL